jgi:hypothetical protein
MGMWVQSRLRMACPLTGSPSARRRQRSALSAQYSEKDTTLHRPRICEADTTEFGPELGMTSAV